VNDDVDGAASDGAVPDAEVQRVADYVFGELDRELTTRA
jgi:hypothetical protein